MLIVMLSVPTSGRTASSIGASHPAFAKAVKRGRIKLRRVKVGRTTLIYDTKIPKARPCRQTMDQLPSTKSTEDGAARILPAAVGVSQDRRGRSGEHARV